MASLEENIRLVRERIACAAAEAGRDPNSVTLVAATKTQGDDTIRRAIAAGVTVCGENRVQEMTAHLDADAYGTAGLHFIGHLQTNKVKAVVGRVDLIQSVDSVRLLEAIDKRAEQLNLRQDILLQVNIGREASKFGVSPEETEVLAQRALSLPHLRLRGLMTVPPAVPREESSRFFREMSQLFIDLKGKIDHNKSEFNCLSMGMSNNYPEAIREGATLVRVGYAIFGARPSKETDR